MPPDRLDRLIGQRMQFVSDRSSIAFVSERKHGSNDGRSFVFVDPQINRADVVAAHRLTVTKHRLRQQRELFLRGTDRMNDVILSVLPTDLEPCFDKFLIGPRRIIAQPRLQGGGKQNDER